MNKKKIFYPLLGMGMLLTSCQSDEPMMNGLGQEQQVSFTVSLPDAVSTRAAGGINSAKGGVSNNVGEDVTFRVALYLADESIDNDDPIYCKSATVKSTGNRTSAIFEPTLVIGEQYRIVAYAEFDDDVVAKGEGVTPETNMGAIRIESGLNNEKNDEYFVNTIVTAAPKLSAELKRPFGKLRLLAEDLEEAERQYGADIHSISVTYKYTRPTTFNALAEISQNPVVYGDFGGYKDTPEVYDFTAWTEYTEGSIVYENETEVEGEDYHTIFVDYIPVNTVQMMPFTVSVNFANGKVFTRDFTQDIPVKRNHLTTLKGRLFTMDSELTLTIEENFDGETTEIYDEDIEWIFANGGTIDLTKDVIMDKPLVVKAGANVVLNLNGFDIVNNTVSAEFGKGEGIIVYGDLTINGEGRVYGCTRALWARGSDGAKITVNGGTYEGAAEGYANGGCSVIYASSGNTIDIYGGTVKALAADKTSYADKTNGVYAALNVADNNGVINVYGGKYYKQNPAAPGTEPKSWNDAHANGFVADGYESVRQGDYYEVVVDGVDYVLHSTYAEVYSAAGLLKWAWLANQDADYGLKLMNDIVLPAFVVAEDVANQTYVYTDEAITVTDGKPSGSNWMPICANITSLSQSYNGEIDGMGHEISGLRIVNSGDYVGFIGCMYDGGVVKNLIFDNAVVYAGTEVGIVAGRSQHNSLVDNVEIRNSQVYGVSEVGALVGRNYSRNVKADGTVFNEGLSFISNCSTDANTVVRGSSSNIGGICGYNYGAVIINSVNNADVIGDNSVGGVVGYTREYNNGRDSYVLACGSTEYATITANKSAGGIAGYTLKDYRRTNVESAIVACYSLSEVVGSTAYTFIGYSSNGTIRASWGKQSGKNSLLKGLTHISTNHFEQPSDITQAFVDDMNNAIVAFNSITDIEVSCPYRWTWVDGSWPILTK